jgi:hypothetical protein
MEEIEVHDQWARTGIPRHIFAGQRPELIYDQVIYHAGDSGGTSRDRCMYVEKQMVDGAHVWEIESKELKTITVIVGSWPHLLPNPAAMFARPPRAGDLGVESKTSGRQVLHRNAMFQDNPAFLDPLIEKYGQEWDPILACLYLQGYGSTKRKTWANLEHDYSQNKLYNLLWARKFEIEKVKHIISDTEIQTMQVPAVFLCGYGMVRECFWQSAPAQCNRHDIWTLVELCRKGQKRYGRLACGCNMRTRRRSMKSGTRCHWLPGMRVFAPCTNFLLSVFSKCWRERLLFYHSILSGRAKTIREHDV